ncbi:hypothetical protein ABT324_24195 [Saccharopolyspora sp. NPDC000359]|uniref:hypothetical protein n=1 Tax=Saccharopolyspora sp. NPDC000359 TaxID=3154251 RepID=UPI003324DCD4
MHAVHILSPDSIAGRAQRDRITAALETADQAWSDDTATDDATYFEHLAAAALAEMGTKL